MDAQQLINEVIEEDKQKEQEQYELACHKKINDNTLQKYSKMGIELYFDEKENTGTDTK